MSASPPAPVTEEEKTQAWRELELLLAGFDVEAAHRIALHSALGSEYIDLHAAIDLVLAGCPPALAERIVAVGPL